ncbi:hypothetical protein Q7P37_006228 [Cladosporium fusiforme]
MQRHRNWLAPVFLLSAYLSLASPAQFAFSFDLMSLWNIGVGLYAVHTLSLFYLEQWPSPKPKPGMTAMQAWKWKMATTYRLWGNPRVFIVDTGIDKEPEHLFIIRRVVKLMFYFLMRSYLLPVLHQHTIGTISPSDVNEAQRALLRPLWQSLISGQDLGEVVQLAPRAMLIRAHTSVVWILESVIFLDGANAALAIIFVCIVRVDGTADWPALFGSLTAVTSMTRFWSRFWHQLATRPYGNCGRTMTQQLLGSGPDKSIAGKLMTAGVVFALSGCSHALVTWQAGLRDWHLEIGWFMLNFCACAFEKLVLSILQKVAKRNGFAARWREFEQSPVAKVIGGMWVFSFLCWSVPKWQYPRMEKQAVATAQIERLRRILSRPQR